MLDPTALYNGALAVYGEAAMARDYGQLVGVDAARASPTHDGMMVHVGRRRCTSPTPPAMRGTTTASGTRPAPAGSPATPSA